MPIDYAKLKNWHFPDLAHHYEMRDTILYALGLGCGADPMDEEDLRFVFEENIRVLPTMAVVLGHPGFWLKNPETGVDWIRLLHGEQGLVLHKPLAPAASVIGRTRVTEIIDKGAGKDALLLSERNVFEGSGDLLCTLSSTIVVRGGGGFGGAAGPVLQPYRLPERGPDTAVDIPTSPRAALIYRLSGDHNPLHADPRIAAAAGFARPILHGLCSFGIAGRAILRACCGNEPSRLKSLQTRFSAPVYPGETVRTEIWRDGEAISFRARVVERDVVVLNNGRAIVAA